MPDRVEEALRVQPLAQVAGQALDAGLVDEVAIDLVPVVMGSGKRYFGEASPARLGDPTAVVQGRRVLHLRYPVERG